MEPHVESRLSWQTYEVALASHQISLSTRFLPSNQNPTAAAIRSSIISMIALVTCSVHMEMIVYVALSIHPIYPSVSQHCHFMPCFIIQKTFEENHQIWHFPDLDRKYEGVILLLRGSVSLQINGVEVDVSIRFDSIGCGKLGRPESVSKIDTGRNALADVLEKSSFYQSNLNFILIIIDYCIVPLRLASNHPRATPSNSL